jgi:hypothetical protein
VTGKPQPDGTILVLTVESVKDQEDDDHLARFLETKHDRII